jgi:hypothetical protein
MSPELGALVFLVAMIALACALLGGLYLMLRHVPVPEEKPPKKVVF